ncbi:antibiotic biosynthesis monooxygenase family protein [Lederbergia citrea]|uniref:antibiotic biosynthesis monooxygenase family protein n=1 Tax=Lederbergia citrea TaxID=2833581 RepID=UPI001BC9C0D3|nr:antibiotic biosynthesis monooxygenase [Lederbergia citrea]MBS4177499.1 antibiotic biosynthesis monooxygenase [Lederbergia citrea]
MFTYITSGTYDFLKKIAEKHTTENMLLMQSVQSSHLWHETSKATVFQSPRKYEVIDAAGDFSEVGFVACNNIPVRDEGRPVFEFGFTNQEKLIENEPGFIAMRVLRPLSSDTYVFMTMWEDEEAYEAWKSSKTFAKVHTQTESAKSVGSVFSGPSYVSTFFVGHEEIEEAK